MMTKILSVIFILNTLIPGYAFCKNDEAKLSSQTKECIECHKTITPGIVADWEKSLHSMLSPNQSKMKPELQRRTSTANISGSIAETVVGCFECHGLNAEKHKDNFEHFGHKINIIVSPNDCATCHETEVKEYQHSKKGYAIENLTKNPIFSVLVDTYTGIKTLDKNNILQSYNSSHSKNQSCFACHGTEVTVSGTKKLETDLGEIEVPVLNNWPNMGVGRINPDGSRGSCTSCHPRHSFSIEIARKPSTCGQCHLEPDVPAYNVYKESKHGSIYENNEKSMNFSNVPWVVGKDFTAPTCATCHNSLITDNENNVLAKRTHDFGSRLWVRIFGLPFAHNQPLSPKTFEILNSDKQNLPTTFANVPSKDFLISGDEITSRKNMMEKVCKACHGSSWVRSHFNNLDSTIAATNKMTKTTTELVSLAWKNNIVNPGNPFEEPIEQQWVLSWLFYANSIRYAAAMSGPDYAGFKNGYFELSNCIYQMNTEINKQKKK